MEDAKAVGGGYCRLHMPLKLALAVRGTVAGHRLGSLEGGGGYLPPFPMHPCHHALPCTLGVALLRAGTWATPKVSWGDDWPINELRGRGGGGAAAKSRMRHQPRSAEGAHAHAAHV